MIFLVRCIDLHVISSLLVYLYLIYDVVVIQW